MALTAGADELIGCDFAKRITVGERPLRVWRAVRGLSQVKLADTLGVMVDDLI